MKKWLIPLFCVVALGAGGQTIQFDGEDKNWEVNFEAGFNDDGYEFGFGLACFADPCIGLRIGLGFAGEWDGFIDAVDDWSYDYWDYDYMGYSHGYPYHYNTYHDYVVRFKFNPAIVLRTPRLLSFGDDQSGCHLFAEPGIVLSPGASGSKDARTFCWDVKGGVNLQFGRFIVSAGYRASNFSLFSGDPYGTGRDKNTYDYITHSAFLGISLKF